MIFQEHKICTFREILIFQSHSMDGKRSNFFSLKNANFLRIFYISTNAPLKNLDIFLRAIHYMTKAFPLTVIIQVLKKITNFSKTKVLYVSRNLNISVALYGWKTFKLFSFEECKLST